MVDVGPFVVPDAHPAELIQPSERPRDDPVPRPLRTCNKTSRQRPLLRRVPLERRDSSVSSVDY